MQAKGIGVAVWWWEMIHAADRLDALAEEPIIKKE